MPIAKLNPSSGFADLGGKPLNPSLNNHYGILTVTASKFTVKFVEGRKWIQFLPIFSAGVVMIVGLSIIVNTLVSAKIILINP